MAEAAIRRLCVVGAGHIGSSILRAARENEAARSLAAYDRDEAVRARVAALGLADDVAAAPAAAAEGADLVILCVPVGQMGTAAAEVAPALKPGAILSDVGSVKAAVLNALAAATPPQAHLVPAHPVAGLEHSGPDSGLAALFLNRWCILTPPEGADPGAVERLSAFWRALGANVEIMTPQHHDLVLAITSHVPHLIAYNIVGTASDLETVTEREVIKFSAGGFRDFTRIAASDPIMWRDIFLNNKEAVLEMLGRFNEDLAALQRAIRWDDGEKLFELFTRTRAIRRGIVEAGQAADARREPEPKPALRGVAGRKSREA